MPLWELVLQDVSLWTLLLALLVQKYLLYYTTAGSGVGLWELVLQGVSICTFVIDLLVQQYKY